MRIISRGTLRDYWREKPETEQALKSWYEIARKSAWKSPHDVKAVFGKCGVVGKRLIVFDICGNKLRLLVKFNYAARLGYVKFVGTHTEYDKTDVRGV